MIVLFILHREPGLLNNHFPDEKYCLGGQGLGTNGVICSFFFPLQSMQIIMHFGIDSYQPPESKKR